jgi:hypothetical protein
MPFFEVSAKTAENVVSPFEDLTRRANQKEEKVTIDLGTDHGMIIKEQNKSLQGGCC